MEPISRLEAMDLICTTPSKYLKVISPRSTNFQKFSRVPLVFISAFTSATIATAMSFLKCATELLKAEGYSFFACALLIIGLVIGSI